MNRTRTLTVIGSTGLLGSARLLAAAGLVAGALLASPAAAQATAPAAQPGEGRLVAFTSLGGGGALAGSDSDATRRGFFEAELGAGWELAGELAQGFRPELALLVGTAPRTYLGLRPGLRYRMEGMPFFLRGAFDFAAPRASWRFRWVLAGAGAEVRFTDVLAAYAEADLGIPLASKAGFGVALRAGMSFRF